jgi:regulatory protein
MKSELSLKNRALGLLARREHSRTELERKLAVHAEDPDEVKSVLDELVRSGMLSDARFAEQYVHTQSRKFGALKLAFALRERGVKPEVAAAVLADAKANELSAARNVWQKKFSTPPQDAQERGKQIRFLQSRGFSSKTIHRVLKGEGHDAQ